VPLRPEPGPARLRLALARRGKLLAVAACVGLLLPLSAGVQPRLPAGLGWLLDLAVHWQWLWLGLLGAALALCAAARSWRWLVLALVGTAPWWAATASLEPSADADAPGRTLTVASANVHLDNADAGRLLQWVRALQADVVVVLEVSPAMAGALAAACDYPHRKVLAAHDPFGMALLSRHPLRDVQVLRLRAGPPALQALVDAPSGPASVTALHTMPPIVGPHAVAERDADITEALGRARAAGAPALVAGDFNATPWSSGLRAAQAQGFARALGLAPTWPAFGAGVFGIPIDHVLADSRWRVVQSGRGPDLGSDHLPVYARLRRVD
jgi:endonuclease/exonuclease/phosphatase (EEP) superfamily protein YafD